MIGSSSSAARPHLSRPSALSISLRVLFLLTPLQTGTDPTTYLACSLPLSYPTLFNAATMTDPFGFTSSPLLRDHSSLPSGDSVNQGMMARLAAVEGFVDPVYSAE